MKKELTNRQKSTLLTIISSFIPSIIVMILGAVKTRYIIDFLGSERNGIYQLMLHLSTFVEFGNLGLASAFRVAYFKTISSDDTKKTTEIYNYSKKFFKVVTLVMVIISLGVSFLSLFIVDSDMSTIQILLLQFLVCAPNILDFYIAKDVTLLSARQKEYIYLGFVKVTYVIRLIISLIIIKLSQNLFAFLSIDMVLSSLCYIVLGIIIKKDNSHVLCDTKDIDKSPIVVSKYLIPNKVSKIVFANIDTILISSMISNTIVSIYTSYIYIINCMISLVGYIVNSFINSLGNLYYSSDNYKNSVTQEIILLLTFIFVTACVPLTVGMESFVSKIWINNSMYVLDKTTYILICLCLILYSVRLLSGLFEDSTGSYKKTYIINTIQAILNIVLSIVLCKFIGLKGVILATVIVLAPFELIKIKKSLKFVNVSNKNKYLLIFLLLSFTEVIISAKIMNYIVINGVVNWIISMLICTISSFIINLGIYCLLFKEFRTLLIELKRKFL